MSFKKYLILLLTIISTNAFSQLSGTYSIGSATSDNYSCLTCSTGVFKAIADSGVSGNVTLEINTDLANETGDQILRAWTSPFTILIKPKSATVKTITYSNSTAGILMKLDSVSNLTIDGSMTGSGRYLRFVSTQTAHAALELNNDCKNVKIANCEFRSDNNSASSIFSGAINLRSYGKSGNDDITIENNLIEDNSGGSDLKIGILVSPPNLSGQEVSNLVIKDNEFKNVSFRGIEITAGVGKVRKAIIQGNSFYADAVWKGSNNAQAMSFIYLNNGEEHIITGNYFGGQSAKSSGNKMNLDLAQFSDKLFLFRIGSGVSGSKPIVFKSNVIKNFQVLGSTGLALNLSFFKVNAACNVPITFGSDTSSSDGNVIGDLMANANTLAGSSIYIKERLNSVNTNFFVFQVEGTASQLIANNSIGGIMLENNSAFGIGTQLIYCTGASSSTISNNKIGGSVDNMVKNCRGMFRIIYSKGESSVTSNSIGGINAKGSFEDDLNLIQIDPNGNKVNVISNTLGQVAPIQAKNNSTVTKSLFGINISVGNGSDMNIVGNSIQNVTVESDDAAKSMHFFGIKPVVSFSGICRIDSNAISIAQESNGEAIGIDFFSPNNSDVSIAGNQVGVRTSNFFENQFVGIDFTGEVTHNNRVSIIKNLIGDTSIQVSTNNSAIWLNGGASGKSETSFGIRVTEPNDYVMITNNAVGGVYSKSSGREVPFIPILASGARDSLSVTGNTVGNPKWNNLWFENHSEFEYLMYLDLADGLKKVTITNNNLSGTEFTATSSDTRVYGIRATRGTAIDNLLMENNTVSNIKLLGTGDKQFTGLFTSNGNTHIIGNEVKNIEVKSSKIGDQFWGVYVNEGNSTHEIKNNKIHDINLTQNQNAENNAIGIFFVGTSSTFNVSGNIISKFNLGVSDSSSLFRGILITTCKTANIFNNVILHNPGTSISSQQAYGIYDFAKTGDVFVYHNTVDLNLNLAAGENGRTACYYKNNDATRKISNNVFANRSPDVGGPHYALYFATSSGAIGSDFNLLSVAANPNHLVHFGVAYDIAGWQKKGFGIKSIAPPSQNFVDQNTGVQLTSLGNDIGLTNLGISTDLAGNSRPMDAGYDLGAYEIATASLPTGTTGMNDDFYAEIASFDLFPNPASNVVHINLNNQTSSNITLQVYNASGQLVLEHNTSQEFDSMDVSGLEAGFYIIHLVTENGLADEKRFTKI